MVETDFEVAMADSEESFEEEEEETAVPVGPVLRKTGTGKRIRRYYEAFEYGNIRYGLNDSVLLSAGDEDLKPYVAVIKDIYQRNDEEVWITGQWLYRPEEAEKKDGSHWECDDPRRMFFSFHIDDVCADAVLHKCIIHFIPPLKQFPDSLKSPGFVVQYVYDTKTKKLFRITDTDFISVQQEQIKTLIEKSEPVWCDLLDIENKEEEQHYQRGEKTQEETTPKLKRVGSKRETEKVEVSKNKKLKSQESLEIEPTEEKETGDEEVEVKKFTPDKAVDVIKPKEEMEKEEKEKEKEKESSTVDQLDVKKFKVSEADEKPDRAVDVKKPEEDLKKPDTKVVVKEDEKEADVNKPEKDVGVKKLEIKVEKKNLETETDVSKILLEMGLLTHIHSRDIWREKLLDAVKSACLEDTSQKKEETSAKPQENSTVVRLLWPEKAAKATAALEEAAEKLLGSANRKYHFKLRSLFLNLKRNRILAQRLVRQELSPETVLNFDPDELKEGRKAEEMPIAKDEQAQVIEWADVACGSCGVKRVAVKEIIHTGKNLDRYLVECEKCGHSWYASQDVVSFLYQGPPADKKPVDNVNTSATEKFEKVEQEMSALKETESGQNKENTHKEITNEENTGVLTEERKGESMGGGVETHKKGPMEQAKEDGLDRFLVPLNAPTDTGVAIIGKGGRDTLENKTDGEGFKEGES